MDRLERTSALERVSRLLARHPIVGLVGARQVGKTTLARDLAERWPGPGRVHAFDLEDPADRARLNEPSLALRPLEGLVVLDEIQRTPEIFPVLRVLADRPGTRTRFLVLGSASRDLLRQASETLAGRIAYLHLEGFGLDEVGSGELDRLWLRGGFPRSWLASSEHDSDEWRREFIASYLERDLPQLGFSIPSHTLGRFWAMLAHYHGQIWNGAEFARAFGISESSVRRYLDVLASTFTVSILAPWHQNLAKRQVKAPKVFIADSGLLHSLLGIVTREDLERHPKVGASWEGCLLRILTARLGSRPGETWYWATHGGAELDLLVIRGAERRGFEIKRTESPTVTRSIRSALEDLQLDRIEVIHAGSATFDLHPRVRAVAAARVLDDIAPLA